MKRFPRSSLIRTQATPGQEIVATTDRYGRPRQHLPTFGSHEAPEDDDKKSTQDRKLAAHETYLRNRLKIRQRSKAKQDAA